MSEPRPNHSFENTYFTEDQLIERLERSKVKDLDEKEKQARLQRIEDENNVEQLHLNLPGVPTSSRAVKEQLEDQDVDEEELLQEPENPDQNKLPLR